MNAIKLGPLVLPLSVLLVMVIAFTALGLARIAERRSGNRIEAHVLRILLLALLVARLYFVWRYHTLYFANPWTIIDIRDGGWDAQAGLIAAWLYTLWLMQRNGPPRRALLGIVGAASAAWIIGSMVLLMVAPGGAMLPGRAVTDLHGRELSLAGFRGKPTVVNFWATWCPPCQREMPAMQKVQQARPDINLVFLNQGETPDTVQGFLTVARLSLDNVLLDRSGQLARDFAVIGYPSTLFFDASGKLVYQHLGEMSEASLLHRLGTMAGR